MRYVQADELPCLCVTFVLSEITVPLVTYAAVVSVTKTQQLTAICKLEQIQKNIGSIVYLNIFN